MAPPVWLVTGVSSGLGTQIASQALQAGCQVVGTVRSRERAAKEVEQIEKLGGQCVELDVTHPDACFDVVADVENTYGRIDCLVNNAGMAYVGAVADFSDAEAEAQMEVNFHGPLRLIRAVLPGMRKRKSGTIVNVSSVTGIIGLPASGLYAASKFALEGLSESLQLDVKEHNIWVLLVEPGAFRTRFLEAYKTSAVSTANHYSTVQAGLDKFSSMTGKQNGDPTKAAQRIVEAVLGNGIAGPLKGRVLRLPLGPDCINRYEAKVQLMQDDLNLARDAAMSTDLAN